MEKDKLENVSPHSSNAVLCAVCGWTEFNLSDINGYEGMCDACSAEKMCQELEAEWERELKIYEKRTGEKLDFNEFYYECQAGNVDRKKLKGLKELKSCYDDAKAEMDYLNEPMDMQMSLNFEQNDLPF